MAAEFEDLGLRGGVWQGLLRRKTRPARLVLVHLGETVAEAEVFDAGPDRWRFAVAIPAARIGDGVSTFLLAEPASSAVGAAGTAIASLPLIAGEPLAHDLRAEIGLLRAEIDLLKREFRRHSADATAPDHADPPLDA